MSLQICHSLWQNADYESLTACYTCALTSEGFTCPASDVTLTRTLCLSSPSNAPLPNTALVIQTCATCSPITLGSNEALATPPASQPSSPYQPLNPELPPSMSSVDSNEVQVNQQPPANNQQVASNTGAATSTGISSAVSSPSGAISPPIHHSGATALRCSALLVMLSVLGAFAIASGLI